MPQGVRSLDLDVAKHGDWSKMRACDGVRAMGAASGGKLGEKTNEGLGLFTW